MPLTWRNVEAPNFAGVAASQQAASNALNTGFGAIQDALKNFEAQKLAAAQAADVHNTRQITDEGLRLTNAGRGIDNQQSTFNLNKSQTEFKAAEAMKAAQPEAFKVLGDVANWANSNDPELVAKGRQYLIDRRDTLIAAGYDASSVDGLLKGLNTKYTEGATWRKSVLEDKDYWKQRGIQETGLKYGNEAINAGINANDSIAAIQANEKLTPQEKAQAITVVREADKAGVYAPEDALGTQVRLLTDTVGGLNKNKPAPVNLDSFSQAGMPNTQGGIMGALNTGDPGADAAMRPTYTPPSRAGMEGFNIPPGSMPLRGLLAKHEAETYDTLFGNAERQKGNPFYGFKPTEHTLGELNQVDQSYGPYVKEQLRKSGQDPRIATPMGKFQIVGNTRRQVAKEMGLSDDTVFTPQVQEAMFLHLVQKRIGGPKSMQGKIDGMRNEWEGLRNVPSDQLAAAINAFEGGDPRAITGFMQRASQDMGNPSNPGIGQLPGFNIPSQTNMFGTDNGVMDQLLKQAVPTTTDALMAGLGGNTNQLQDPNAPSVAEQVQTNLNTSPDVSPADQLLRSDSGNRLDNLPGPNDITPEAEAILKEQAARQAGIDTNGSAIAGQAAGPSLGDRLRGTTQVENITNPDGTAFAPTRENAAAANDQSLRDYNIRNQNAPLADPTITGNGLAATSIAQNMTEQLHRGPYNNIVDNIMKNGDRNETVIKAAERVTGENGELKGVNPKMVIDQINAIVAASGGPNKAPIPISLAADVLANSVIVEDTTNGLLNPWGIFGSDKYGAEKNAIRFDMEKAKELAKIVSFSIDGSPENRAGLTQRIEDRAGQQIRDSTIPKLNTTFFDIDNEVKKYQNLVDTGRATDRHKAILAQRLAERDQILSIMQGYNTQPDKSMYKTPEERLAEEAAPKKSEAKKTKENVDEPKTDKAIVDSGVPVAEEEK